MKKTLLLALLLMLPLSVVHAQLRLGVRVGTTMGKLHFSNESLRSEWRTGLTVGFQLDVRLPLAGLAADASAMFATRSDYLPDSDQRYRRNYIDIPIHLRYSFPVPAISSVVSPYVFTGPQFSLLCHESKGVGWDNRSSNTAWDIGGGVELFRRVQVSVAYTFAIDHTATLTPKTIAEAFARPTTARDRHWSIGATLLF